MSSRPRIAFFGTPDLAVYVLEELLGAGIVPDIVVTVPDKPAGRTLVLTPPPVKVWALEHDVPVLQPESLRAREDCPELANSEWDLFIVAAYNVILRPWVLELPKHGNLNVHPSLLPKLRGPSPIRSALLRDTPSDVGVTIIDLDEAVDHGPIVAAASVELPEWPIRGRALDELLFREGGRLLAEVVPLWLRGAITPEVQDDSKATFTQKLVKADGKLDLAADPYENYCKYCAYDGWPGTFFFAACGGKQVRVKVGDAHYEDGAFVIDTVIPEGKKEQPYDVFTRSCANSS
jgi:methionyl-tRNA formyltransferase